MAARLRYRSLQEFRDIIEQIVDQGLVDIMLMSAHTNEILTIEKRIFDESAVTPAARANDTTDIHIVRGSRYPAQPSLPFRTATLDHIQCGHLDCAAGGAAARRRSGPVQHHVQQRCRPDREALREYKEFRLEAERKGFRHFLEVFDPNRPEMVEASKIPEFINDAIVRTLGGVTAQGRPLFLKMVYHGPKAMEELVHYDPNLIVGILGGGAGTTYDAFKLLSEAKKYGARVALFGRKINNAENQLAFIRFCVTSPTATSRQRKRSRHIMACSRKLGVKPHRSLKDDMVLQTNVMSYDSSGTAKPTPSAPTKTECGCGCKTKQSEGRNGEPDFRSMSPAEKVAYQRARWDRILG